MQVDSLEQRRLLVATLVEDINPFESVDEITRVGNTTYFVGNSEAGRELWKTDGTEAGTTLVKDINSGSSSSNPANLTDVNGTLYFQAEDAEHGVELWKSDGTEAGTVLVKDISPTGDSSPMNLIAVGDDLFFTALDSVHGNELWKSDGTAEGTNLVRDLTQGTRSSNSAPMFVSGGELYFSGSSASFGMWKTDGTESGTVFVSASGSRHQAVEMDGYFYYSGWKSGQGFELWRTDGTAVGTELVKDIYEGSGSSSPTNFIVMGGELYFSAATRNGGRELWKSDGTADGTDLFKDIYPRRRSGTPEEMTVIDDQLFFKATDRTNGWELWVSDGTVDGTHIVKDIMPGRTNHDIGEFTVLGDSLYFRASDGANGYELWKSDGTEAGTEMVQDINQLGDSNPRDLANIDGSLYFEVNVPGGSELWTSDGAAAGTSRLAGFDWGTEPSDVRNITPMGQSVAFTADDGTNGKEVWVTNGTEAGTTMVTDHFSSGHFADIPLTELNGEVFFAAGNEGANIEFWKTDGTVGGTTLVKEIANGTFSSRPASITNVNGTLYFSANDGIRGNELWKSDGTTGGTTLVADIYGGTGHSNPSNFAELNGEVYFSARGDFAQGTELWKTDGTTTTLVKNIRPGSSSSSPSQLTKVGNSIYFTASDGTTGIELWKTDGTANGTVLVKDIYEGGVSSQIDQLIDVNGTLFFGATDGVNGYELWKSDGTPDGTTMVKDILSGRSNGLSRSTMSLTNVNGTLFFTAYDYTHGTEIWTSDGTEAGTVMLADVVPGRNSSTPHSYTQIGNTLYFAAQGAYGPSLWERDLTTGETTEVRGVNFTGATDYSSAGALTNAGGTLYFSGQHAASGRELFVLPKSSTPPVIAGGPHDASTLEDSFVSIDLNATDPDADPLVWSVHTTPANGKATFEDSGQGENTTIRYTPNADFAGTDSFVIQVEDGAYGYDTVSINVTVDPINDQPSISFGDDVVVGKNAGIQTFNSFAVLQPGGGDDELTQYAVEYMVSNDNPGMFKTQPIIGSSGLLLFEVAENTVGTATVSVRVRDSGGTEHGGIELSDVQEFTISVDPSRIEPYLVADVNRHDRYRGNAIQIGSNTFFVGSSLEFGAELWISDGTANGPRMLKDIRPGKEGSYVSSLTNVDGTLYFRASDGFHSTELWKSDGTEEGTVMVRDINPGGSSGPSWFTVFQGALYFSADDGNYNYELWRTDGTEAGTVKVTELNESGGSHPRYLTVVGQSMYFTANDGEHGQELWKTDGTEAGTQIVRDIRPGINDSSFYELEAVDGTLFFSMYHTEYGDELWKSDGSEAGTVIVKDIYNDPESTYPRNSSPRSLTNVDSTLFFTATDGTNGRELWVSDGSSDGTTMVTNISDSGDSSPGNLLEFNGQLYFAANDDTNGRSLWTSDGTVVGTTIVQAGITPWGFIKAGSNVYFSAEDDTHGRELWKTDGTVAGTAVVADIGPLSGSSNPHRLSDVGGAVAFYTDVNGAAGLWMSDGSEDGTTQLKEWSIGSEDSNPYNVVKLGDGLMFNARTDELGVEIWKTNESEVGVELVKEISLNPRLGAGPFTQIGDVYYFQADDGVNGREFWRTDGTTEGTYLVKDVNPGPDSGYIWPIAAVEETIFFGGETSESGKELWKSDGTEAGTVLLKEINPGPDGATPYQFVDIGGTLFFSADDGTNGRELWKSDGTAEGTVKVKDINPGSEGSDPQQLTNMGGTLYFTATNGVDGVELWKSDGTEEGTVQVKDISAGNASSTPNYITAIGDKLYFHAETITHGLEPWVSDGTEAGTMLIKDINPGASGSETRLFTEGHDGVYFSATDGIHGTELWKTDGTSDGTTMVKDIALNADAAPFYMTSIGDHVYFTAREERWRRSYLWKTDGTAAGTEKVASELTDASNLTAIDGTLYFSASSFYTGKELWALDLLNNQPTVSLGENQVVRNDAGTQSVDNFATIDLGDEGQIIDSILVSSDNNSLFTVQPAIDETGRLTYTPNPGASGIANVTVQVRDDGGTANGGVDLSDPHTFSITILTSGPNEMLISEILFNPEDGDHGREYIELNLGSSGQVVPNTYLVALNGNADEMGLIENVFDLSSVAAGTNEFVVLTQNGAPYSVFDSAGSSEASGQGWDNWPAWTGSTNLQNTSTSYLLVSSTTPPRAGDDADPADNGNLPAGWNIVDSIAFLDRGANDRAYGSNVFVNGDGGVTAPGASVDQLQFTPAYVARRADSSNGDISDWIGAAIDGYAPNYVTSSELVSNSDFAGEALDHLGETNFLARFTVTPEVATQVREGSRNAGSLDIQLNAMPTSNVEITLTTDSNLEISSDGQIYTNQLVLNAQDLVARTITYRAIDDEITEGTHTGTIDFSFASEDPRFNGDTASQTITIADNEQSRPDLQISRLAVLSTENDQVVFSLGVTNNGTAPANLDAGPGNGDNLRFEAYMSPDELHRNSPDDRFALSTILGESPLGTLLPGETYTGTFTANATVIDELPYLTVAIDTDDVVTESTLPGEANNTAAVELVAEPVFRLDTPSHVFSGRPGSTLPITLSTQAFTEQLLGFQLNFDNTDPALQAHNWSTNSAQFPFALDGDLDTANGDTTVAASAFGRSFSAPVTLGSFDLTLPQTPGTYTFSLNSDTPITGTTLTDAENNAIPIHFFGDISVIVSDDMTNPEANVLLPVAGTTVTEDRGYVSVELHDLGANATGIALSSVDVNDVTVTGVDIDRVEPQGDNIYHYYYGEDGDVLPNGQVDVEVHAGEIVDGANNAVAGSVTSFTFDNEAPSLLNIAYNVSQQDPADRELGPQPTNWANQRSDLRDIELTFDEDVSLTVDDIVLTNLGFDPETDEPTVINLSADQLDIQGNVATLSFDTEDLGSGIYQLDVTAVDEIGNSGSVPTVVGSTAERLYELKADWNGDGSVTVFDFNVMAYWFGLPSAPAYTDLNGDGGTSIFDFGHFRGQFGERLEIANPPSANDDGTYDIIIDGFDFSLDVLGNDNGSNLKLIAVNPIVAGETQDNVNADVFMNPDGTIGYEAADVETGYQGTDLFSYTISDGNGLTDTAVVAVKVSNPVVDRSTSDVEDEELDDDLEVGDFEDLLGDLAGDVAENWR